MRVWILFLINYCCLFQFIIQFPSIDFCTFDCSMFEQYSLVWLKFSYEQLGNLFLIQLPHSQIIWELIYFLVLSLNISMLKNCFNSCTHFKWFIITCSNILCLPKKILGIQVQLDLKQCWPCNLGPQHTQIHFNLRSFKRRIRPKCLPARQDRNKSRNTVDIVCMCRQRSNKNARAHTHTKYRKSIDNIIIYKYSE